MPQGAPKNRVMVSTTTTGTGTLSLGSALTGWQGTSALTDGSTYYYCCFAVDGNGNPTGAWEVGKGTYTASGTTFSRDTIEDSSNGGSAVNFAAGTKYFFNDLPASQVITADGVLAFAAALNMGSHQINNVSNPTAAQDAATKVYVEPALHACCGGI